MSTSADYASTHLYRHRLIGVLEALALPTTHVVCDNLLTYLDLLDRWNSTYNLTAIKNSEQMLTHHLFDCLAIVPAIKRLVEAQAAPVATTPDTRQERQLGIPVKRYKILDVGSGAGLPGLVIAAVWPEADVTTIDAVAKKTAFQQHVIGALRLPNARSIHGRIESQSALSVPDVIVCRAYASLQAFVTSVAHLAGENTWLAAQKGRMEPDDPLPPSGWATRVEPIVVPDLAAQRHLVIMKRA